MAKSLKRILCIDDDLDILSILDFSLTVVGGFEVMACNSGSQALGEAEAFAPQLFLIDVMMPNLSGPETLDALHKKRCFESIPAIFLTANTQFSIYSEAHPPKILGVLTKPFDSMLLPSKILELWNQYM